MPAEFSGLMFIVFQKAAFQDANVCLFVFDCIYFNDISLMDRCVWQGKRLAGLVSRDKLPGKPHQCRETSSPGLPDWLLTVKSGLHGRDLAVPRNFTVELLWLSQILGLAASQLLMSPKHTINVEFLFYPFLEESKNELSSLELSRMNHLMP